MKQKPYAAFGHVLIERSHQDGETYTAEVLANPQCSQFWVKGRFKNRDLTINEAMPDFVAGTFLSPIDYYAGMFEHTAVGDTTLFCFHMQEGQNDVPALSKFVLAAGEATTLPQGTKLFHCAGEMTVNGNTINKPTQIRSATNVLSVTATTDCYGIIFG